VIGAQFHDPRDRIRRAYANPIVYWPPLPPSPMEITTRIWWPAAPDDAVLKPKFEYRDLGVLLREARSGDTILIRHNGPLAIEQHFIQPLKAGGTDRADFHLLFKPETKDMKPVLSPAQTNDVDVSLFRVKEGRVSFEDLHFLLKPAQPKYQDQIAVVTLVAGRGCEFKNCTFTLDEEDGRIAAVVSLADSREMKMDGPASQSAPSVKFTGCLIRGKGRALSVPVSRPFALEMNQCITGLNGPVVFAKAGGREVDAALGSTIHLSRVTALLGGPLVELQGGAVGVMKTSALVSTMVTADHCLFAAVPGAGQPMVEVDGAELDRSDPKNRIFKWTSPEPNRFANFDSTLPAVVVKPDVSSTQNWKWTEWLQFAREVGNPVGSVKFQDEPDGLKDLMKLKPADVEVRSVELPDMPNALPGDAGADVEKVAVPLDFRDSRKENTPVEP
jgi:hypothetical protein